ncbi:hypothetical protein B5E58_04085 [Tyzzerella sp. An114]|uniref:hypothetical protein n=1 Tax=Tyzzerella sp. An114 TaxID=1965545 RepID=UPI000B44AD65|nr:hypothetical protein [Tyzzerella sp. An114]OUQ59623.1 hypothetical protein B5E58_04085 [Tyzzerella sp. An114]
MANIYNCENCGGIMEFNPNTQTLQCPNCNNSIKIENFEEKIIEHRLTKHELATIKATEKKSHTMECNGCGAKIEVDGNSTTSQCPYCGSKYVLADKQEDAIIPDGIVPFKIDKHKCNEIFKSWIKGRWLAPIKLKHLYQIGELQGIYIPYWTFDAFVTGPYRARGGITRTHTYRDSEGKTRTKTVTNWYPVSGTVQNWFDDVLIPASTKINTKILDDVDQFNTKELVSYSPEYMSGYNAECFNINLDSAHKNACNEMFEYMKDMVRNEILRKYDKVDSISLSPIYNNETYKHIVLPVYSLAYMYSNKLYNVVINGQNGAIDGEYPLSAVKITAIVITILILIFIIYLYFKG